MIGIDPNRRLIYEGSGKYGHGLWPSPFVSVATIVKDGWTKDALPTSSDLGYAELVFREDVFDPITRIRRGRFYARPQSQPNEWHVQPHPAFRDEVGEKDYQGNYKRMLFSFHRWPASVQLRPLMSPPLIALGFADAYTLWRVVAIERIVTGEDLVTLRARSSMGVLAELAPDQIPSTGRDMVLGAAAKVVDAAYREGAEAIVDRCRHAAQAALGVWMDARYSEVKWRTVDIGQQASRLASEPKDSQRVVIANTASTLARLHVRTKPNEQIKREPRLLVEDDGEAAIGLLGLMFREFEWCVS